MGVAVANTGLEIETPEIVEIVYTIEPDHIDKQQVQDLIEPIMHGQDLQLARREDAQLFVRVEQHSGQYLLYVDFNRQINYTVADHTYTAKAFVWGRYANNIDGEFELFDDISFFIEEFVADYKQANKLK